MRKVLQQSYLVILLSTCLFFSCKDKGKISANIASSAVQDYIEQRPIYETATLYIGSVKWKALKDSSLINTYKALENKGYLHLDLDKEKKRFLSKDSNAYYTITLTDKAKPFVTEQGSKKVEVKTIEYVLDEATPLQVEKTGKVTATTIATLKKQTTDFYPLAKDKNSAAPFLKKEFKLKYKEETGWQLVR